MVVETLLTFSIMLSIQTAEVEMERQYLDNASSIAQTVEPKEFKPEEFKTLWQEVYLPNTERPLGPPPITDNESADSHIRKIAESRGYEMQPISNIEGLQSLTNLAMEQMKKAAEKENINLSVASGFRSVNSQRSIFLSRLNAEIGRGYSYSDIADGLYDTQIQDVLRQSSIPGYSKHHSGYAVDLQDTSSQLSFTQFKSTEAFDWISRNNYENAKKFGFIPSYPEGVEKQGPEPEAWEYTWVGITNLTE